MTYTIKMITLSALVLSVLVVGLLFERTPVHLHASGTWGTGVPITGFAWSDTIGWISLYCTNTGVCDTTPYGIEIDTDGQLFGYAWSDTIGWVSAETGDVTGCPAGTCAPYIQDGMLHGWMRAIAPKGASSSEHGGWGGWISLSGSNYGVVATTSDFSGYAWGSDIVGWLDFSYAQTEYGDCAPEYFCTGQDRYYRNQFCVERLLNTCIDPLLCQTGACVPPDEPDPPEGTFSAAPILVNVGDTVTILWSVGNVVSCGVTGGGNTWSGTSGEVTPTLTQQTTFTLTCLGNDDSTFERTTTVYINPAWSEF